MEKTSEPAQPVKDLEKRVLELERELDAIINFSSDEIMVISGDGIILRANSVFEESYGVKIEDILGRKAFDLEAQKIFSPSVTRLVMQSKKPHTVIQSQRDGRKLLATGTPVFNPDGSIFRIIANTRDITHLKELELQLEEVELLKERYYQELLELRQSYAGGREILISSTPMRELIRTIEKVAMVDSTVFLTGESGVGKGVIARYIHDCSPRRDEPFITVNCGAIPENLLESELFGYSRGAFTGARKEGKAGKIELADQGTLLLDEITELPFNLQVKLLHVIQEGIISRVGDTREINLDLRFLAATNRDVEKMVEEGKFREDLYFRLNVIPVEIPPLRARKEDIEPMALHFLKHFNSKYRKTKTFDPEVFPYLQSYNWPGNVRELENLVERLVIVVDGELITARHLPENIRGYTSSYNGQPGIDMPLQPLENAVKAVEKEMLKKALQRCSSTYEMADLLGVNQSTVVRKLQKYGFKQKPKSTHLKK
ncbi:MAG TPA: sigma 54-interacting transcriptional regulator [Firmicutes bacterium]|nr:sigma 54-interacting transcriptional regulator [Bacillota bacterium]